MNSQKFEKEITNSGFGTETERENVDESKNCPFCDLYLSEIGINNGTYKDKLFFSVHSNLESHKLEDLQNVRRKRNGSVNQSNKTGCDTLQVS
jgi:hypothetical protein